MRLLIQTAVSERSLLSIGNMAIQQGQFVEVRGRPWLVEAVDDAEPDLTTLRLSCIADDAQGECFPRQRAAARA
jgi:hypothetical protein